MTCWLRAGGAPGLVWTGGDPGLAKRDSSALACHSVCCPFSGKGDVHIRSAFCQD